MAKRRTNTTDNSNKVDGKQKRKSSYSETYNAGSDPLIDSKAKKDIIAIIVIVLGLALLASALIPTDAPVTYAISNAFKYVFGIGIYILPFVFIGVGISIFFHMEKQKITYRVAIGLSIILVGLLSLITMFSNPILTGKYEDLFNIDIIFGYGGIIGSSIVWSSVTLMGPTVSAILIVGLLLAGLVVLGLSITNIIKRLRERKQDIDFRHTRDARFNNNNNLNSNNANIPTNALFDSKGDVFVDNQGRVVTQSNGDLNQQITSAVSPDCIGADGVIQSAISNTHVIDDNNKKSKVAKKRLFGYKNNNTTSDAPCEYTHKLGSGTQGPNQTNLDDLPGFDFSNVNLKNPVKSKPAKKTKNLEKNVKNSENSNVDKNTEKGESKKDTVDSSLPKPQEGFVLPSMDYLVESNSSSKIVQSDDVLQKVSTTLQKTLQDFGINANVVGWIAGPTVTLFKVDLPAGIRVSKITALNDDIALALASPGVRVFAPIPGTTYVGIEVPNQKRQTVLLRSVLSSAKTGPLQIAIGKDVEDNSIVTDLAKMPHLLIGGTTGSGKSVSINAMIMSILMRATPSEVRLILIDPKRVEFTPYNDIPHLYVPVVTEPKEAASALSWGVAEMERRLKIFSDLGARNICNYNDKVSKMSQEELEESQLKQMPYIVIIIDELADLMMAIGKEIEYSISRIAQLARAAGIHLIVATQRPSTNVVTGLIKANITNRIAFNVASGIDSRVILDSGGAESLIGLGDLLFNKPEFSKPLRIQGCFVSEDEIAKVVNHLKEQGSPHYHKDILKTNLITVNDASSKSSNRGGSSDDDLLWEAAEMIVSAQFGSTSSLQRRFKIGYARAGRIMDLLEEKGIVGAQNGSKPREVLVDALELESIKALDEYDSEQK